jgi:hypothetical protein
LKNKKVAIFEIKEFTMKKIWNKENIVIKKLKFFHKKNEKDIAWHYYKS